MGKAVRRNSEAKKSAITKEVLGMGIVLFSVLSLFCLVLGDLIYPVGQYVRGFFLGVFGYYSFVFFFLMICLGIRLVLTRSILSKEGKLAFFFINLLVFGVFGIVHLATKFKLVAFGECLAAAYAKGTATLGTASAGGAVFSLISYPIVLLAKAVGCYIFYSIFIVLCMIYFLKLFLSGRSSTERAPREPKAKKPKREASAPQRASVEVSSPNGDFTDDFAVNESQQKSPGLFLYGGGLFETKSKKDYKNDTSSSGGYAFAFGRDKVDPIPSAQKPTTYSAAYGEDIDEKLKYITTPARVDLNNLGQSPVDAGNRGYRGKDKFDSDVSPYGNGEQRRDVYRISNPTSGRNESISGFDRASSARREESYSESRERDAFSSREGYGRDAFGSSGERDFGRGDRDDMRATRGGGYTNDRFAQRDAFDSGEAVGDRARESDSDREVTLGSSINKTDRFMRADFSARDRLSENAGAYQNPAEEATDNVPTAASSTDRAFNPLKTERMDRPSPTRVTREPSRTEEPTSSAAIEASEDVAPTRVTREALGNNITRAAEPAMPAASPIANVNKTPVTSSAATAAAKAEKQPKVEPEKEKPNPIDLMPINYKYKFPPLDLLKSYEKDEEAVMRDREIQQRRADDILDVLSSLKNIDATIDDIIYGPSATRFVLSIPRGVQMKTIVGLQKDFQVRLAATNEIRMLVPIPGTSQIGIEVANSSTTMIGLKEILKSKEYKNIKPNTITFALGKSIIGSPIFLDIMEMPHLIIAGATGTGKSVCLNSMLISLLYRYSPEDLRLIIVDPKMVEFEMYKGLPHLMFNDILANDGRALAMLEWATIEMDRRYMLFKEKGARKLVEYNSRLEPGVEKKLPYLIILIDEFAELMMTSDDKKKVENYVGRLAQKARAAGISLIFATQRPSADVIDGSIKTNFSSRICFKTSSGTDSFVVLGENGAEKLLGKGDVLYRMTSMPNVDRAQGAYIGDDEVLAVTNYIREHNKAYYDEKALELINKTQQKFEKPDDDGGSYGRGGGANSDPDAVEDVYLRALRLVILTRNVSKTSLQTKLGVGYPKAAKIIDWMEEMGYVSASIDNKQRTIYITKEIYESKYGEFVDSYR